jgi:hypothetical protein
LFSLVAADVQAGAPIFTDADEYAAVTEEAISRHWATFFAVNPAVIDDMLALLPFSA